MRLMLALSFTGILLCVGMLLRAKVPFFRNMLAPACVTAGIIGFIGVNVWPKAAFEAGLYADIVNQLFTVSFISIGLTAASKQSGADSTVKNITKGAWGMGVTWSLLYALTPLVGAAIVLVIGKMIPMDPIYAMMIPFGFAQGPGQAATFGGIIEQYGWDNAAMVGATFAAVGFLAAFMIGVPLARLGIKKGLCRYPVAINPSVMTGIYSGNDVEEPPVLGRSTTYSGNIDTLAFHFALIGICYVMAVGMSKLFSLLPGFIGTTFGSMLFFNGLLSAYAIKFLMKKLKLTFLQNDALQSAITGWATDFLVVCSFMMIRLNVINQWLIPIIIECVVITVITLVISVLVTQHISGENAYERLLGFYGMATGTIPTGIALVRIVDPQIRTTTVVELGMMNIPMIISTPVYLLILGMASGSLSLSLTMILLAGLSVLYGVLLLVTRCLDKKQAAYRLTPLSAERRQQRTNPSTL